MYVVTGGAGFIGSNVVSALNSRGYDDVVVVDNFDPAKAANLEDLRFSAFVRPDEFLEMLTRFRLRRVEAVLHFGGCADTRNADGYYLMDNIYRYTASLIDHAALTGVPLVYASSAAVYHDDSPGIERPSTLYGAMKLMCDNYLRAKASDRNVRRSAVSLRLFNVYGPGEGHKGDMASMVMRIWRQGRRVSLFRDGSQRRDFVHVRDVAALAVSCALDARRSGSTVYDVGTGRSLTFNELARLIKPDCQIEYVDVPEHVRDRYQNHTRANVAPLREDGHDFDPVAPEVGVPEYVSQLDEAHTRPVGDR